MDRLKNIDANALNEIGNILSSKIYGYEYFPNVTTQTTELAQKIFGDRSILLFEEKKGEINSLDIAFNAFISNVSSHHFYKRAIDDEIKLLKSAYPISNDILSERNINISDNERRYKSFGAAPAQNDILRELPISKNEILNDTINADYIDRVDSSNVPDLSFLFTTKKTINGKILLCILIKRPMSTNFDFVLAFIYSYSEFNDMACNPVRLFLKSLDYYGEMVTINGATKKFWYHEYIHKHSMREILTQIKLAPSINSKQSAIFFHKNKNIVTTSLSFVFSFNAKKYIQDLKAGRI